MRHSKHHQVAEEGAGEELPPGHRPVEAVKSLAVLAFLTKQKEKSGTCLSPKTKDDILITSNTTEEVLWNRIQCFPIRMSCGRGGLSIRSSRVSEAGNIGSLRREAIDLTYNCAEELAPLVADALELGR